MHAVAEPAHPARLALSVGAILVAVALAQLADLVTFRAMVGAYGMAAEANPIVVLTVDAIGVEFVSAAKLGLIAFVVAVYALLIGRYGLAGSLVATVAVAAGFIGAFSNLRVLMT